MNCNRQRSEQLRRMNSIYQHGKIGGIAECKPLFVDNATKDIGSNMLHVNGENGDDIQLPTAASASLANVSFAMPSIDAQTAAVANSSSSTQSKQSLYFSQEASTIFDKALEMHAAPTDDPPMWGDDLEDFKEVADMLEDIEDLSPGNDNNRDFCSNNLRNEGSFGSLLDDCSTSDAYGSPNAKFNGQDLESTNNVQSMVSGSNYAALAGDMDLPVQLMNMDERIFEDNMILGDSTSQQGDSVGAVFDSRDIFDNRVTYTLNPMQESPYYTAGNFAETLQESTVAARALPIQPQIALNPPASKPHLQGSITAFQTVTPVTVDSDRIFCSMRGTPTFPMNVVTPLQCLEASVTKVSTPSIHLKHRSNVNYTVNSGKKEVILSKNQVQKHQRDYLSKATNRTEAAWKRRFLELEEFKRVNGHCNVPQKYEKNTSLGAWVARQRLIMRQWEETGEGKRHGRDTPTGERAERLKNLGLESSIGKGAFGKQCSRNANEWEKQFADLLKYRLTHGTCNVPTKCTTLGRWVSSQRKKYRQFLVDGEKKKDQDQIVPGWSKELRGRFQRLRDVGFNFHLGKGNAQQNRKSPTTT